MKFTRHYNFDRSIDQMVDAQSQLAKFKLDSRVEKKL